MCYTESLALVSSSPPKKQALGVEDNLGLIEINFSLLSIIFVSIVVLCTWMTVEWNSCFTVYDILHATLPHRRKDGLTDRIWSSIYITNWDRKLIFPQGNLYPDFVTEGLISWPIFIKYLRKESICIHFAVHWFWSLLYGICIILFYMIKNNCGNPLPWKNSSISGNSSTTERNLLSLQSYFYQCHYTVDSYEALLVTSTDCSKLSILTSSFICRMCVVSLKHMQIDCLAFSVLEINMMLQSAELMDAAFSNIDISIVEYKSLDTLVCIFIVISSSWPLVFKCLHFSKSSFVSRKKIVLPHPLLFPLQQ